MANRTNTGTKQSTEINEEMPKSAEEQMDDLQAAADEIKERGKALLTQAKSTAGDAYETVTEKTTSKIEEQKAGLSGGLVTVADSIRRAVDSLNDAGEPNYVTEYSARYAQTAADKVQRVAQYFENTDLKTIARDTEDFARRNPAIFLGAAFGVGILVARFFKSAPIDVGESRRSSNDRNLTLAGGDRGPRSDATANPM